MNTQASEKKVVIFVDDESNILNGLRRLMRSMSNEWDMHFVDSGKNALEFMETNHVDVVVTDMIMPEMDGSELLAAVSDKYPHTVRIVLSGQATKEEIYRAIKPSHQYLAKPCDIEILKTIVRKTFFLRESLANDELKIMISNIKHLPVRPELYTALTDALKVKNASISDIGNIINKDAGMSTQILKIVNSAYFGLKRTITDVGEATSYLGVEIIKSLVLSLNVFDQIDVIDEDAMRSLWEHGIETANLAKHIALAAEAGDQIVNESFTAGLLHCNGYLILADNFPYKFEEFKQRVMDSPENCRDLETEIFGASQSDVGAYLLGIWGLPDAVAEAVTFYRNPEKVECDGFSALTAVHIADAICSHGKSEAYPWFTAKLNRAHLQALGLESKIPEFIQYQKELVKQEAACEAS